MPLSQFTIYQSSDASAPVLSGTVGSLVAVLDACLVTGYGAKAGAGWTKPFTGTDKAAFRNSTGGTGFYLRVQDDGPGVGTAKEARITGYESMSDVDTGSAPFPTAAQGVGGIAMVVARKSASADATPRDWIVVADAYTFYFFARTEASVSWVAFAFGDFYSIKTTADAYRCMIIGRQTENSSSGSVDGLDDLTSISSATAASFIARTSAGTGGSITMSKHGDATKGSATLLSGNVVYPNTPDSGLYLSPVWICESSTSIVRGRMRGFYQILHPISSFGDADTFSGANSYSGKTFLILKQSGNVGIYTLETSATVETN